MHPDRFERYEESEGGGGAGPVDGGGARLAQLYACAEAEALRTVEWYLADRLWKRRAARLLRGGTLAGAAGGVALPLLGAGLERWGLLALLGAAVCLAGDRYLGLTSGWMRDMATAQALRRRLAALRYDWVAEDVREPDGPPGEAAERRLAVLRRFSEDVTELVRAETADWMREFRAGAVPVAERAPAAAEGAEGDHPRRHRFPGEPARRPSMPRQRPGEPPRP
ncbi:SLATT domain-containing protein [Streptomyces sp. NBC_01803]|uniref:SLATT domain-containing protein n=1 Tax=Streptomyces sp. NBC_01803 TaxID=2975946 RepID=UPI002DDBB50E|nr:SLATT domain-containing protein [Streptomyces sp. NBC_01803]WSA45062.1 SLATT domain-containing protein [Streptomyces sp. NBC_01803]